MKERVFITGGVSLLGAGLLKEAPNDVEVFISFHKNSTDSLPGRFKPVFMEMRNGKSIKQALDEVRPNVIIHAAAQSNVDYCEKNQKETWEINVKGTQNLLSFAKKIRPFFVFISTNAVFDGKNSPYGEEDTTSPINFYGKTKAEGEKIAESNGLPYSIVRLITMYGWEPLGTRLNPVTWKLEKLKRGEVLHMVKDRFINPLYNLQAAEVIWKIVKERRNGIYHIAGKDTVSRHEWALLVAKIFGFSKSLIKPVNSDYFAGLAPRPTDTTFKTRKMEKELGSKPLKVKEGLLRMKQERK